MKNQTTYLEEIKQLDKEANRHMNRYNSHLSIVLLGTSEDRNISIEICKQSTCKGITCQNQANSIRKMLNLPGWENYKGV